MLALHRKLFPSSKGTNWITAHSVLTFLLPATIAVEEVSVDVAVDVAAASAVAAEVVDSVETAVAEVVDVAVDVVVLEAEEVVVALRSKERRLHSKLAYPVPLEGLWAIVGLWV
jgi:hypothetical protein